jgi:hypothetical protein
MNVSGLKWAAAFVFAIGLGASIDVDDPQRIAEGLWKAPSVGVTAAEARPARRVARRTARRTTRRTSARINYYASLPAGCVLHGAYHYCGGVYYQPVVQDGATVYVIVTP